jgi:hypothetical protein
VLTVLRPEARIGDGLVALQALLNLALWDTSDYVGSRGMVAAAAVLNKWGSGVHIVNSWQKSCMDTHTQTNSNEDLEVNISNSTTCLRTPFNGH